METLPPRRDRPEPTFRGTPPFPQAAKAALANGQLRANLGRATATIRTKRAAVVEERADWEALRLAGAAIKDEVIRDMPALLSLRGANLGGAIMRHVQFPSIQTSERGNFQKGPLPFSKGTTPYRKGPVPTGE